MGLQSRASSPQPHVFVVWVLLSLGNVEFPARQRRKLNGTHHIEKRGGKVQTAMRRYMKSAAD